MSLQDIVQVTITKETASVSRAGFGTPCILAFLSTTHFAERARVYEDIDALEVDGFGAEHFVHKAATAIFSQNPKVTELVVGRRALAPDRKVSLFPTSPAQNLTAYRVKINDVTVPYTSDAVATLAEITAGLEAGINALSSAVVAWAALTAYSLNDVRSNGGNVYLVKVAGTSAASGGPSGTGSSIVDGTVTWEFLYTLASTWPAWAATTVYAVGARRKNGGNVYQAVLGGTSAASGGPSGTRDDIVDNTVTWKYIGPTVTATDAAGPDRVDLDQDTPGAPYVVEVEKRALLTQKDTSADPGIVTDLSAVRTALDGNDDWYGLCSDAHSEAEIRALAASIETLRKVYIAACADDETLTGATDDVFSELETSAYARTAGIFHTKPHLFPDAAWLGKVFPLDPGSETWKFKTLAGIPVDKLSSTEENFLDGKKANHYQLVAGVNMTAEGTTGSGEFIDITRFIDALQADIEENVFTRLASLPKIPYTDDGIAIIENEVRGALLRGIRVGGLVADPAPTVTVPRARDVSVADKNARILRDVLFTATLAGAVHALVINGRLTV